MKKIPAIRSNIGNWTYYTATLTFEEVAKYVDKMSDEIYTSKSLKKALQRSITDNYISIKNYIINQKESRFFNSIVLAIYDGNPNWIEIELDYEDEEFYNLGFLTLSGEEHIFPVDGQHRVEGIKKAIEEDSSLKNESIPIVFIGHSKDENGMQKSRRLFNTLNRYAKPVTSRDILILDEDDLSAIGTRFLIEDSEIKLFKEDRIHHSEQKALAPYQKKAFTSLITLGQCNLSLLKTYFKLVYKETDNYTQYKNQYFQDQNNVSIKDFTKYRPDEDTVNNFLEYLKKFWNSLIENSDDLTVYLNNTNSNAAESYRNNTNGGNILFRPVGILPYIEAILTYHEKKQDFTIEQIIEIFKDLPFNLNAKPWNKTVWNDSLKIMNQSVTKTFIKNTFLYLVDPVVLTDSQKDNIKKFYASSIQYEQDIDSISYKDLINLEDVV